jgi:hypothetical protein
LAASKETRRAAVSQQKAQPFVEGPGWTDGMGRAGLLRDQLQTRTRS